MWDCVETLAGTRLFAGIEPGELGGLLDCLGARRQRYAKGAFLIEEGSATSDFGVLLSGRGRSVKWDEQGRLLILTLLGPGSEIGVLLAASPGHRSPVSVQALNEVEALHIPYARLLARCPRACPGHERLLQNYIGIVAHKGLVLHERIDVLLKPSLRSKILTYLLRVSREQPGHTFSIPLSRGGMAEYLNTERSALSRELSRMKRDGLIDYHQNSFRLL